MQVGIIRRPVSYCFIHLAISYYINILKYLTKQIENYKILKIPASLIYVIFDFYL